MVEKPSVAMLRWVFGRPSDSITCEVDFTEDHGYDVSVVPHSDVSAPPVEHFNSLFQALERHVELADTLRKDGWTMIGSITRWAEPGTAA